MFSGSTKTNSVCSSSINPTPSLLKSSFGSTASNSSSNGMGTPALLKSSLGSLSSTSTGRSIGTFSKLKHSKKINFKNYLNDGDSISLGNNGGFGGGLGGLGLKHQSSLQFGRAQKTKIDDHSINNGSYDDDNLPRPAPIIPNSEIKSPPTLYEPEDHGIGFYNVDKDASALAISSINDTPSPPADSESGSGAPKGGLQSGLGLGGLSGDSINANNKARLKIGAAGVPGDSGSSGRNRMFTMDQYLNNL
ncbi:unnamed protein product [Ambrosiozyma monospora]|uniref:Unnamed protein product n=1 Tax=Ambrosiozyma monospora TaxID=43982 RepID=A0A9W6WI23_AMBMO|nr:unnamed protein product [Ambrosiozyma monospora]